MRHQISNKNYKDTIGLISHLILTRPDAVRRLLKRHGVVFSPAPTRGQLIAQVVALLAKNNPSFNTDISKLLAVHIKYKGGDMLALERNREDEFLGGLLGGVAKNLVSNLFKKKSKSSSGSASAAQARQQAGEIEKIKADMQRQMEAMEKQRRAQQEQQRRQMEEDRRLREEQDKKKRKRLMSGILIAAGSAVVITGIIVVATSLRPKQSRM
ncbi:MAG: hypothetical protein KDD04_05010 [Sinomicrobium sp.]|nr:hypothetical protein [Sinomicrobium sp.]